MRRRSPLLLVLLLVITAATVSLWTLRAPPAAPSLGAPALIEEERIAIELTPSTPASVRTGIAEAPPTERALDPALVIDPTLDAGTAALVVRVADRARKEPVGFVRLTLASRDEPAPDTNVPELLAPRREARPSRVTSAVGDETGRARFTVEPGQEYRVSSPDDQRTRKTSVDVAALAPGEVREVVLHVQAEFDVPFVGRVFTAEDGLPIANARIRLFPAFFRSGPNGGNGEIDGEGVLPEATTRSDAEGWFELASTSWKDLRARIDAPGRSFLTTGVPAGHATRETALSIRMRRSASLVVSVLDARGRPVEPLVVRVSTSAQGVQHEADLSTGGPGPAWQEASGSGGVRRFVDLPSDAPLSIEVHGDDTIARREVGVLTLEPGEERAFEVRLASGTKVLGTFVDAVDRPVANHELWLVRADGAGPGWFEMGTNPSATRRTDARGRFAFTDVTAGDWWVGPSPYGLLRHLRSDPTEVIAPRAERIRVVAEEREIEIVVRAHRGLAIRGQVLDPSGRPAASVAVQARARNERAGAQAWTDSSGRFELTPLAPGEYDVAALEGPGRSGSASLVARTGDESLVLRLVRAGDRHGVVLDESGKPCKATLTITRLDLGDESSERIRTSFADDGYFDLESFAPREYALFARADGGRCGLLAKVWIDPSQPQADVIVRIGPGATLRVQCEGTGEYGGFRIDSGAVRLVSDGFACGDVSVQSVVLGTLTIRTFEAPGRPSVEQTIEIAAGETRDVTVAPYR